MTSHIWLSLIFLKSADIDDVRPKCYTTALNPAALRSLLNMSKAYAVTNARELQFNQICIEMLFACSALCYSQFQVTQVSRRGVQGQSKSLVRRAVISCNPSFCQPMVSAVLTCAVHLTRVNGL